MADDIGNASISVRNMISIFENSSPYDGPPKTRLRTSKSFSRSHTSLKNTSYKEPSVYDFSHQDLRDIEQHLKDLELEIKTYDTYSKDDHTYFQTELVSILSEIVNVESRDDIISSKKKNLILIVRNLNALLTSKLPGEQVVKMKSRVKKVETYRKPSAGSTTRCISESDTSKSVESLNQEDSASVGMLRRLFEEKCREDEQNRGLNIIVKEHKGANIRRVMSFGGETSRYKYLPYKDLKAQNKSLESDEKYVVEGVNLKDDRVIHKASIHRYRSFKEIKLDSKIVETEERQDDYENHNGGITVAHNNENDSDIVVSSGMVSKLIGKMERTISIDSIPSIRTNSDADVERKFDEIFTEEITDESIGNGDTNEVFEEEKVVVLCQPKQIINSTSENNIEDEIPSISVSQMIRQLENNNNNTNKKVLYRTVSSSLPNYAVDSDTSDSIETVINAPISHKSNSVIITEVNVPNSNNNGQFVLKYEDDDQSYIPEIAGKVNDGEESEDSLLY